MLYMRKHGTVGEEMAVEQNEKQEINEIMGGKKTKREFH